MKPMKSVAHLKAIWNVSEIEFADGIHLPFGCYAIFKSDNEVKFFDDYKLREVRKENPLEHEYYCVNDDQFLKVA